MPDAQSSKFDARLLWIPAAVLVILVFFGVRHLTRPVLRVRVAHAERQSLTRVVNTNGKVEPQPQQNFEAHAPAPGTIKALYVHAGQVVRAGQLLLTMDDADARARVATAVAAVSGAQASLAALQQGGSQQEQINLKQNIDKGQSELALAQQDLATLQRLQAQGAASTAEVQTAQQRVASDQLSLDGLERQKANPYAAPDLSHARAAVAEAQSAEAAARAVVDESNVRSPINGTVYSLPVSQTEFVQQGQLLLAVANLTKLQVRAYFDEPEIGNLAVGQPATIVWDAKRDKTWTGHVVRLPSTIINYGTRNVGETLVSIDNPGGVLLPNTNVTVTVTTEHLDNVLTIPREALHTEASRDFVYVVHGDTLHRRTVTIGALNLTAVQITSGLQQGELVAVGTVTGDPLTEGVPIRIVQ